MFLKMKTSFTSDVSVRLLEKLWRVSLQMFIFFLLSSVSQGTLLPDHFY